MQEIFLEIAETIEQLCELTKRWTAHEDIPKSQQHECRTLGRELHKRGGESLMREAFYVARGRNPAASVIQCYWDNIGDWRW